MVGLAVLKGLCDLNDSVILLLYDSKASFRGKLHLSSWLYHFWTEFVNSLQTSATINLKADLSGEE